MNITKEIKCIMQEKGVTVTALNNKLNYKNGTNYTPQNLSKRLNKEDIKFGDARDILEVLGYKIDIVEAEKKTDPMSAGKDYISNKLEEAKLKIIDDDKTSYLTPIFSELESVVHNQIDSIIKDIISSSAKKYIDALIHDAEYNNSGLEIKSVNNSDNSKTK